MGKKKETDIKIKIAIISGLFLVSAYGISAYVQSPLADSQWKDRPILDISFGKDGTYPTDELIEDKNGFYYVELFGKNRGNSDGRIVVVVQGTNAMVRMGEIGGWVYEDSISYSIQPNATIKTSKIYITPDNNAERISVGFFTQQADPHPPFQESNLFTPTFLTFENVNGKYKLFDQQ